VRSAAAIRAISAARAGGTNWREARSSPWAIRPARKGTLAGAVTVTSIMTAPRPRAPTWSWGAGRKFRGAGSGDSEDGRPPRARPARRIPDLPGPYPARPCVPRGRSANASLVTKLLSIERLFAQCMTRAMAHDSAAAMHSICRTSRVRHKREHFMREHYQ
jgi:hypothetical protein